MYLILEVPESATMDQIKVAYRRLVRKHHPDVASKPNAKMFATVQQAYNVLGNVVNRSEYDSWLRGVRGQEQFKKSTRQVPEQSPRTATPQPSEPMRQEAVAEPKPEQKQETPKRRTNGPKGTRLSDWFTGLPVGPTTVAWV